MSTTNANSAIFQQNQEDGTPASGYRLYTYVAGTDTPLTTYQDYAATQENTNPIVLDANGNASIWIGANAKFILKFPEGDDTIVWTQDNIKNYDFSITGLAAGINTWLDAPSSANLAAAMTDETGTGKLVFATNPTLITPRLGVPFSGTLTNCTGLPISTGVSGLGTNVGTFLATPSSANLAAALTDETGTGANVFATSPTLVTPILGTPTSGTLTNCTGLPVSTGVSGLGTGVATFLGTPSSANLAAALTDETGSGAAVFATSPTLVTPALGTPSSGTLTNCTGLPVAGGGTGRASHTAYAVICGGTTSTGAQQSIASVGTAGYVLTSNGAGQLPTFETPGAAISAINLVNSSTACTVTDSTGRVTFPACPSFYVYNSVNLSNVTGDNTSYQLILDTKLQDVGNNYNTGNGLFTCPVNGTYIFHASLTYSIGAAHTLTVIWFNVNGTDYYYQYQGNDAVQTQTPVTKSISLMIPLLTVGDNVRVFIRVTNGTKTVTLSGGDKFLTSFSGRLLG